MKEKLIALKPYNNQVFYNNNIFRINNGNNAFCNFDLEMKKRGFRVETIDMVRGRKVYKYIYADVPYPWELLKWLTIIFNTKKNILLCLESPLIVPFNHFKFVYRFFDKILTWNDLIVDNEKILKLNIPQIRYKTRIRSLSFNKKKLLVGVYSYRTLKNVPALLNFFNPYKSNLYSKRMDLINYLDSSNIDFDLYGRGWNRYKGLPKSYGGEIDIDGKLQLISKYKYCLAFENSSAPGYITEKIFDCFQAGTVPIYLGANNISKYIPNGAFIDARKYSNFQKLVDYLRSISKSQYIKMQNKGREFINDQKTIDSWFQEGFMTKLGEILK